MYYISDSGLNHGQSMPSKYPSAAATFLAIAILTVGAACGDKKASEAGAAPAREIQLAPSAPVQPQLNDAPAAAAPVPQKTAPKPVQLARAPKPAQEQVVVRPLTPQDVPAASAPAPAPVQVATAPAETPMPSAPPTPKVGTISAGRTLSVRPVARVCTNTFKAGDRFTTILNESVSGLDGAIIPAGSSVVLKVDESTRSINSKDSLRLTFSAVSLRIGEQSYDLTGHVAQTAPLEKVRVQSTGDQAKKVGAGALIGALAGQLLGRNTRSTVMGGAVGAAAGAAVAAGTADYDGCVPTTMNLTVSLDSPLFIKLLPN
jgi:hypothetical protein